MYMYFRILFLLSKIIRYACYCVAHGSTAAAAEKAIAVVDGVAKSPSSGYVGIT